MPGKMKPQDNSSNMKNVNKGTPGTNKQNSQMNGNRSKQLAQSPQPQPAVKAPGKGK